MLRRPSHIVLFFCFLVAAFQGCVNDVSAPPPSALKLGDSTISNSFNLPVSGGTFYFNTTDTANSARIIFAANSYSGSITITLSVTKIVGSSFGADITPLTSLYTIDAGGAFSNNDIIINFPITLDTNNFTMAFFYDKLTHDLEGVPTVGYAPKARPPYFSITLRRAGSFFLSSIPKSKLASVVSSSFDPKTDNWEFPNYGTILTPNGQFAGQTLTGAWYYYEQALKGSPHLYGTFDTDHGGESPKIWQDNNFGFQFAAQTQKNLNWDSTALGMISPLNNGNIEITADQLIYSMMVTGKPQIITVVKNSIVVPMIAYKITNGVISVADPNFPVSLSQNIPVNGAGSNKYTTAISIHDKNTNGLSQFSYATYIGVRAMIDWDRISKTWQDAQNGVANNFPQYTVAFSDSLGSLVPLNGGYLTFTNKVTLTLTGPQPSFLWIYQNGAFTQYNPSAGITIKPGTNPIGIYFQTLSADASDSLWSGYHSVTLYQQVFAITTFRDSSFVENDMVFHTLMTQKPPGSLRYEWDMGDGSPVIKNTDVDSLKYRYRKTGTFTVTLSIYQVSSNSLIGKETSSVTISMNPVFISPIGINGIATIPYVFYGILNVPKDIIQRCEWSMGDGSSTKSNVGFDTIQYAFQKNGTFTIKLNIFDNSTNALLGLAEGLIMISQVQLPTLAQLQSMRFVNVEFDAKNLYKSGHYNSEPSYYDAIASIGLSGGATDTSSKRIIWNGFSFNSIFKSSSSYDNFDTANGISNSNSSSEANLIGGTFSNDLSKINISASYTDSYSSQSSNYLNHTSFNQSQGDSRGFDCNEILLLSNSKDSIVYQIQGFYLINVVSKVVNSTYNQAQSEGVYQDDSQSYVSTYWQDPLYIPTVKVIFRK